MLDLMAASSITPAERARKQFALLVQRLAGRQAAIATAMGTSESTVSRFKTEQGELFCAVLAHAGLKIVPAEKRCYDVAEIEALLTLARRRLEAAPTAEQLTWDD